MPTEFGQHSFATFSVIVSAGIPLTWNMKVAIVPIIEMQFEPGVAAFQPVTCSSSTQTARNGLNSTPASDPVATAAFVRTSLLRMDEFFTN
jgi:hypothetical protein